MMDKKEGEKLKLFFYNNKGFNSNIYEMFKRGEKENSEDNIIVEKRISLNLINSPKTNKKLENQINLNLSSKLFLITFILNHLSFHFFPSIFRGKQVKSKIMLSSWISMFIISLLLILITLPGISPLGITPGRTTLMYEPGMEKDIQFSVLNNQNKDMQVIFMVQGELNSSIKLKENIIEFSSSEESKQFSYNFIVPEGIERNPGLHTAEIMALEVPKADAGGTYVGATVAVVSQLYFYVPYPGKYVDADLNVLDAESNGTATFIIPVINRGKLGIGEVRGVIDVYNSFNEKIASINTDYYSLEPGKRTELSAKWDVNTLPGDYLARFSVFYDGETRNFEKQFIIGIKGVSIESILVNNFILGEIAKMQILVHNRWNEDLNDVYANLIVYDNDYQTMADVKSASEKIPALSEKELIAYWDTIGVQEGEYDGKLMIKYGEKSTDKNLLLKVGQDRLEVIGVGYAIRGDRGGGVNMVAILLVLVIILLIVNVAWFIFFKRSTRSLAAFTPGRGGN